MGVLVAIAVLAVAAPWLNIPRDQADSAGMLAHLHAYFVDGDLLYDDEYAVLGMSPLFAFVTGEGVVSNHWPAGATWLQAPGYLLGLLANRALAALDLAADNPLGVVPLLSVRAWAVLVAAGCLGAVARAFARAASAAERPRGRGGRLSAGTIGALAYGVGTPLLYYALESPLRPHLWGQAVVLVLVLVWMQEQRGSPSTRTVTLSALAGLATAVRPQLAVLWLLAVHDAWPDTEHRLRRIAMGALAFAPWPLLHARLQLWMYGGNLGDYAGGVSHHLWHFLMSPYHGALLWSPVLALGLALVVWAAITRQRGGWLIAVLLAGQIWLDAGMRDIEPYRVLGSRTWAGGVSFGARKLLDVLPLFLPSALALTRASQGRRWRAPLAAGVLALVVPTALLHLAALIDPTATTGTVLDHRGLLDVIGLAYDPAAWRAALDQRLLDPRVAAVVTLCVSIPLAAMCWRIGRGLRGCRPEVRLRLFAAAILAGGVLAHVFIAALQLRTEAVLHEQPDRMVAARARMQSVHEATVRRIPAHHARLRALLGEGAAPEPTAE